MKLRQSRERDLDIPTGVLYLITRTDFNYVLNIKRPVMEPHQLNQRWNIYCLAKLVEIWVRLE